ncbi:glycosyltransferase [Herbiconiux sp. KACC 21604]|uniref:glycosyltransferase n=1 Tax=unclassified Herbiconiux TaxID=2618217 RepID=UPI001491AE0D|nr:glycosyltransferase [Herbiconiux sp. SALV-R1]QJU54584.1 glycosyltransferase [Herbiconiux sp. SALV-R1]WPO85670.1 glycosyltransferase [Herbiconiux sp. KACC 21604]
MVGDGRDLHHEAKNGDCLVNENRVLIEPIDPRRSKPGGVDTCIRGLIKYRPDDMDLFIVGVDAVGDAIIGEWRTEMLDGRSVQFLPVYRADNTVMRPRVPHIAQLVWGVWKYRKKIKPDTLQTHRITTGFAVRRFFRKPNHVQFIHNDGDDSIKLGNESYFKKFTGLFRFLEKRAVRECSDVVIFNSAAAKRLSQWGDTVRFSPTWYDDEYFYPAESSAESKRTDLLWVGRFEETKDPLLAVRALSEAGPDYTLTMLGGGSLLQKTKDLASELGISDRIDVVGPVEKRSVSDYLRRHSALLMTSHHEGFPRAVVESLACGLPVVTTAGGEPNGLVVEGVNGTRIAERTPASTADAVRRVNDVASADAIASVELLKATILVPFVLGRETPAMEELR